MLESGHWSYNGPKEQQFNQAFAEFIGTRYAICAANGTVTLQLALEACGIGLGDEVIVPGLTWQATAAAVLDVNAVPILVDVVEDTWCMDPQRVQEAITARTKAIIPVHLYGSFVDMDAIMAIARQHALRVIEDCAHKHGGEWNGQKAGSIGDIGSFSFQLSKLMTAGEGGALTTSDPVLYERLDALRNCGRRPENVQTEQQGDGFYGDEGELHSVGKLSNHGIPGGAAEPGPGATCPSRIASAMKMRSTSIHCWKNWTVFSPMRRDQRETREAYFNFVFRYHQGEFKGLRIDAFRAALSANSAVRWRRATNR